MTRSALPPQHTDHRLPALPRQPAPAPPLPGLPPTCRAPLGRCRPCRYLGRNHGLYPTDAATAARVDQLLYGMGDLKSKIVPLVYSAFSGAPDVSWLGMPGCFFATQIFIFGTQTAGHAHLSSLNRAAVLKETFSRP